MPITQNTTPTLPRMAAVKVEAQAERNGESVPLALCAVCDQPTAEWVVAQNAQVIQDPNDELMRPDHGGDEDGFWGFVILLLAIVVSFALGWVMSSAVGV